MENNIDTLYKALCAPFHPRAIRWRVKQVYESTASAMPYVNSRDVQDRLDSVLGMGRWQCDTKPIGENRVAAGIGVYLGDELGWVWKWDGAGETAIEGNKGAFSDSFKRAAVKWGVARYLYNIIPEYIPAETYMKDGKRRFTKFLVSPWELVKMNLLAIRKQVQQDLKILVGDDGTEAKKFAEILVSLNYSGTDTLNALKGFELVDVAYNVAEQAAAIQEMEQDNAS